MRHTCKGVLFAAVVGLALIPVAYAQPSGVPLAADDHAGHKHEDHKDEAKEADTKEIAGYTVKVVQESGVEAGQEAAFAVVLTGRKEKPKAVRAWVGVQSAEGSVKGKAVAEGDQWHAHVEVPNPIPSGSQFWVEIETESGKKRAAFDYRPVLEGGKSHDHK